jgi:Zn-dependent oligopeptidase
MTVKSKAALKIVQPDLEQMEAVVTEAAKQAAPMVQRLATHRDRFDLALKELESERTDLVARRDLLRRQAEAVDSGLSMHIDDIDATMKLYQSGMSAVTAPVE